MTKKASTKAVWKNILIKPSDIFSVIMPQGDEKGVEPWPEIPLIFSVPHSGRIYPPEFLASAAVPLDALRQSEDSFVDQIFAAAPQFGAHMLVMQIGRIFIDVNRAANALDPLLIADPLPDYAISDSALVASGIGVIARLTAKNDTIYQAKIPLSEALARIDQFHRPFHAELTRLVAAKQAKFGRCTLIECHSMPPHPNGSDIVLGDLFGTSCAPELIDRTHEFFQKLGYKVRRNDPYAGGYITQSYGNIGQNIQVLQIEISRKLYLDGTSLTLSHNFPKLVNDINLFIKNLASQIQQEVTK